MPRKAALPEETTTAPAGDVGLPGPEGPVGTPAPAAKKRGRKSGVKGQYTRSAFTHCVFVGASNTPKFWAKSVDEAKNFIGRLKPGQCQNVTVAELTPVRVVVDIKFGPDEIQ